MASRRGKPDLTPEQVRTFLQLVQLGMYPAQAARKIGVTPHAMMMRRKRKPEFDEAMEAAEASAEMALLAHVVKAAPKDWRAAMGLLERRFPERWARPEIRNEVTNVNVAAADVAAAIHAGLAELAKRHAPPDEPDVDAEEPPKPATSPPDGRGGGVSRA